MSSQDGFSEFLELRIIIAWEHFASYDEVWSCLISRLYHTDVGRVELKGPTVQ